MLLTYGKGINMKNTIKKLIQIFSIILLIEILLIPFFEEDVLEIKNFKSQMVMLFFIIFQNLILKIISNLDNNLNKIDSSEFDLDLVHNFLIVLILNTFMLNFLVESKEIINYLFVGLNLFYYINLTYFFIKQYKNKVKKLKNLNLNN
jgi:hypothetical protein